MPSITLAKYTWEWAVASAAEHAAKYSKSASVSPVFEWNDEGIPGIAGYVYNIDVVQGALAEVTPTGDVIRLHGIGA